MPVRAGVAGAILDRQLKVGVVVLARGQIAFVAFVAFDGESSRYDQLCVVNFCIQF